MSVPFSKIDTEANNAVGKLQKYFVSRHRKHERSHSSSTDWVRAQIVGIIDIARVAHTKSL